MLGGEQGQDFPDLNAGDVVVLPEGTGHKRLSTAQRFARGWGIPSPVKIGIPFAEILRNVRPRLEI